MPTYRVSAAPLVLPALLIATAGALAGVAAAASILILEQRHLAPPANLAIASGVALVVGLLIMLPLMLRLHTLGGILAVLARGTHGPHVPDAPQRTWPLGALYVSVAAIRARLDEGDARERQAAELREQALRQAREAAAGEERNRLARELHDTLAHTLSAVSVQLSALEVLWDNDPAAARQTLLQTRQLTRTGLDEARRALHELRAQPIEELGFVLALQRLAERAAQRGGLALTFAAPPSLWGLRPEVEQHLYRIAEEALNNVVRHANARHLTVSLAQDAAGTHLAITDDGRGFDPTTGAAGHYGLTGMHERAFLIGASVTLTSEPDRGTTLRVRC